MRCRLKKTIQIAVLLLFVIVYINFMIISRNTSNVNDGGQQLPHEDDQHNANKPEDGDDIHDVFVDDSQNSPVVKRENVYPNEIDYENDRILQQLNFIPPSIAKMQILDDSSRKDKDTNVMINAPLKKILLPNGITTWAIKRGQSTFQDQKCPVQQCSITDKRDQFQEADVVLYDGMIGSMNMQKLPHQIWLIFMLESPYHTPNLKKHSDKFNWTASYRHDSTIVAPYEKFVPYNSSVSTKSPSKNYAIGKTKMVAWFVSNCGAQNMRMQYATRLAEYIEVDIYGHCGTKKCPRHQSSKCFDMLNHDYRFYLSFENSNCRDYITEKFYINGLKHDVIPIVMGAAPEDYKRAAPPHSYIHVDDFASPKELAEYLEVLVADDKLYNEYFKWKGTGDIINTYFWCRVCALAHDVENRGSSWYGDVNDWWRGNDVCIGQRSWRDMKDRKKIIGPLALTTGKNRS